jgi:hypothetical protein
MRFAEAIRNITYITATITVGRFRIKYQWYPYAAFCGTAWGWESNEPDGFDGTPEQDHLEKLQSGLHHADEEFMDALVAALEQNPFQPEGESK